MLKLPLNGLYRPASADEAQPWLLVLMHGVGSNAQDLFGLASYVPQQYHVLSLQAPYPMGHDAYAWFMFSVDTDGTRHIDVMQEQQSRALVTQTVIAACEQLDVSAERVIVGGFSQGGIMSLSLLLTQPELLAGVCIWHSRLLPEVLPEQVAVERFQGHCAWVSHGTQDNVIALTSAHAICSHLQGLPVTLRYEEYPCQHTIHPQELQDSMQWLSDCVGIKKESC
ncbi:alpha/beta hydrolase [Comamonas sp. NoAH]|uniref:alpha/beta hydrolase n=1 Tax=Comamonas halotolerans TaxID=3041496 RepID=UPI0024E08834|nr:dienelactone hydrolase family protein [Comamonas sp. NoAH]